jgi:predicted MFS family arabinose efflux permease
MSGTVATMTTTSAGGSASKLRWLRSGRPGGPAWKASLFRDQTFRNLFIAATVSMVGTQVSFVAIPLVAVSVLNATPAEVGVLGMVNTVAFLLIGLPAGVWLDRMRLRRVMVAADLARTLLLASVPAAWALGVLTLVQLYVTVLICGVATVFFDVATLSYLPTAVGRDHLVEANTKLSSCTAGASVVGPSIAGFLVQATAAPVAVAVDAASYLWSCIFLKQIRRPDAQPQRIPGKPLLTDVFEGIKFVLGHPLLRPIALVGAATNLFIEIGIIIMPLIYRRELGLSASALGIFFAAGGAGVFLGSFTARRFGERFGHGMTLIVSGAAGIPFGLLLGLIDRGIWQWLATLAWLVLLFRIGLSNVILVSVRQLATPDRMLNRMNATMRFLFTGVLSVGAAVAGLIGQFASVRVALWVCAVGLAFVWIPIAFSPLKNMHDGVLPAKCRPAES